MTYLDHFNVDDTEYLIPGSESSSPLRGSARAYTYASDISPGTSSSDDQRSYRNTPTRDQCRYAPSHCNRIKSPTELYYVCVYANANVIPCIVLCVERSWVQTLRPLNTSGQHLMKPFIEKMSHDSRMQRSSSIGRWDRSSGISKGANSPSRYPRSTVPQIFAYEPKTGVYKNLNYPAFSSIRIEQVNI